MIIWKRNLKFHHFSTGASAVDSGSIFYILGVLVSLLLPIVLSVGMGRLIYGPKQTQTSVDLEMSEIILLINNEAESIPVKFSNGIWKNFDNVNSSPNISLKQRYDSYYMTHS